jgi:hypothetical protein
MVHADEISKQLRGLGVNFQFWCRAEVRELPKILFEGEQLNHVLIGRYEGGFALFCATDRRVLLIDKKPFYLTLEDIRYDMISEVQYNHRLIDATMRLGTVHKTIAFTGYNHTKLRNFTSYIQEQVMFYRQQQNGVAQTQPFPLVSANPINKALATPKQPVMNPYKMPVMIRRRVSRFY